MSEGYEPLARELISATIAAADKFRNKIHYKNHPQMNERD